MDSRGCLPGAPRVWTHTWVRPHLALCSGGVTAKPQEKLGEATPGLAASGRLPAGRSWLSWGPPGSGIPESPTLVSLRLVVQRFCSDLLPPGAPPVQVAEPGLSRACARSSRGCDLGGAAGIGSPSLVPLILPGSVPGPSKGTWEQLLLECEHVEGRAPTTSSSPCIS